MLNDYKQHRDEGIENLLKHLDKLVSFIKLHIYESYCKCVVSAFNG